MPDLGIKDVASSSGKENQQKLINKCIKEKIKEFSNSTSKMKTFGKLSKMKSQTSPKHISKLHPSQLHVDFGFTRGQMVLGFNGMEKGKLPLLSPCITYKKKVNLRNGL